MLGYALAVLASRWVVVASTASRCGKSFFGLIPWFGYFPDSWFGPTGSQHSLRNCDINDHFQFLPQNGHSGLLLVALAIFDDLIRVAGLVAVGFIIYGGMQYVTSQGSPDQAKQAQGTIVNALIGLLLAVIAASLVQFIGSKLAGS